MDPDDIEDEGADELLDNGLDGADGEDDAARLRADGRAAGKPTGSLTSLKIRKRSTDRQTRAAAPATPPTAPAIARPAVTSRLEGSVPPGPGPAADPISRVTRRAQSAVASRPAGAPAPAPRPLQARTSMARTAAPRDPVSEVSLAPVKEPPRSAQASRPNDLVAYWTRLRGSRRFPRSADIDAGEIGESWPSSILIRCRPGSRVLEPEKIFLAGEGAGMGLSGLRGSGRVNLSPMMLQWLLGLAGEVVRECRPMNDVETFPSVNRVVRYRAVALPFSEDENAVDHVLCHVKPEA